MRTRVGLTHASLNTLMRVSHPARAGWSVGRSEIGFNHFYLPMQVDIHIHCKEWDRLLVEGNWKPEKIVAKLPTFLQFLRTVQSSVAP